MTDMLRIAEEAAEQAKFSLVSIDPVSYTHLSAVVGRPRTNVVLRLSVVPAYHIKLNGVLARADNAKLLCYFILEFCHIPVSYTHLGRKMGAGAVCNLEHKAFL